MQSIEMSEEKTFCCLEHKVRNKILNDARKLNFYDKN